MDRRGLRGIGKAYAASLLDLEGDLLPSLLLRWDGAVRLHPSVDFYAQRSDSNRDVGFRNGLCGKLRTGKDLARQVLCLGFNAPQVSLVAETFGIKLVDILGP